MLGIRPENIVITNDGGDCPMRIDYIENHGNKLCIAFTMNGAVCMATADIFTSITENNYLNIEWDKVHLFDADTTDNLGYPDSVAVVADNPFISGNKS